MTLAEIPHWHDVGFGVKVGKRLSARADELTQVVRRGNNFSHAVQFNENEPAPNLDGRWLFSEITRLFHTLTRPQVCSPEQRDNGDAGKTTVKPLKAVNAEPKPETPSVPANDDAPLDDAA